MRIVLTSVGSLGDLHPIIALARALREEGFQAEIAATAEIQPKVAAEGFVFHPIDPSVAQICAELNMTPSEVTEAVAKSSSFLFQKIVAPHLETSTRQLIAACDGASAIVGATFTAAAAIAADALKIPFVSVALQPVAVLSPYDPPVLPEVPWLRPARGGWQLWLNKTLIGLVLGRMKHWTRPANALRRRLGLPPVKGNLFLYAGRPTALGIGLFSPLLSPRQPDAADNFHLVGYAPYDSEGGGASVMPPPLQAFLDAGPPPIIFTLGSAAVYIAGDFYRESLKAAAALGRRAVLLVGPDGDLSVADGAPDAIALPYAPFSALFPQAAAIVHQGGVGTTQQAMRSGRPQLVVPHLGDQYDNAARVVRLGVAATVSRADYKAASAAQALDALLSNAGYAETARQVGAAAAAEDGARAAAQRIAALLRAA